jgi:hypothetical protein
MLDNGNESSSRNVVVAWKIHDQRNETDGDDPAGEPAPGAVATGAWPNKPGQFSIETRLAETDWQSADPAAVAYRPSLIFDRAVLVSHHVREPKGRGVHLHRYLVSVAAISDVRIQNRKQARLDGTKS